ncbi:hypothetical protein EEL31_01600 [Brevibacillus laterosporus]|uniref:Uncharacterized protein n=1 Tax=Brevibacillus laterosporus TaxID=1465 RepID=A0A518V8M7_BRELA|nr:hypothetical protein [Brevibacillus laterosporus]QDX93357.1 hypothetical protein EEL30_14255 [Brevibacillus laterosporus]TPG73100.1 hypothetical protein EEL31_01600 [Brevibacillus laterosporus]
MFLAVFFTIFMVCMIIGRLLSAIGGPFAKTTWKQELAFTGVFMVVLLIVIPFVQLYTQNLNSSSHSQLTAQLLHGKNGDWEVRSLMIATTDTEEQIGPGELYYWGKSTPSDEITDMKIEVLSPDNQDLSVWTESFVHSPRQLETGYQSQIGSMKGSISSNLKGDDFKHVKVKVSVLRKGETTPDTVTIPLSPI